MRNIIDRIKALRSLPGFHTLTGDRPMADYELVTMMLSALVYKKRIGKMTLFTDEAGYRWASRTWMLSLYDDHKYIEVPKSIDKRVFWAAGKLVAMSKMKAPCVSVDLDAVLFERPNLISDVVALHPEPFEWEVYGWSPFKSRIYEEVGAEFESFWQHPPANVGVLAINDEFLRSTYTKTALMLMMEESTHPVTPPSTVIHVEGVPVTQMVLAEQYLISAIATKQDKHMSFITDLDVENQHMVPTRKAMHLWNSKRFYAKHTRAREQYISWALTQIHAIAGESEAVNRIVRDNGLPTVLVIDGNTGVRRWSYKGEWNGPGEVVGGFPHAD
jgi:hypothetical protein